MNRQQLYLITNTETSQPCYVVTFCFSNFTGSFYSIKLSLNHSARHTYAYGQESAETMIRRYHTGNMIYIGIDADYKVKEITEDDLGMLLLDAL